MAKRKTKATSAGKAPPGVWNRRQSGGPANPIRVRTKRLDELDGDKLALAFWLLAKQAVRNDTDIEVTDSEARRVAKRIDEQARPGTSQRGTA